MFSGALDIVLNEPGDETTMRVEAGECFSTPGGAWRSLAAAGDGPVQVALITSGDGRKRATWAPEIMRDAMAQGYGIDHDGHVAPLALLPPPTRAAVTALMTLQAAE